MKYEILHESQIEPAAYSVRQYEPVVGMPGYFVDYGPVEVS